MVHHLGSIDQRQSEINQHQSEIVHHLGSIGQCLDRLEDNPKEKCAVVPKTNPGGFIHGCCTPYLTTCQPKSLVIQRQKCVDQLVT